MMSIMLFVSLPSEVWVDGYTEPGLLDSESHIVKLFIVEDLTGSNWAARSPILSPVAHWVRWNQNGYICIQQHH